MSLLSPHHIDQFSNWVSIQQIIEKGKIIFFIFIHVAGFLVVDQDLGQDFGLRGKSTTLLRFVSCNGFIRVNK